MSRSTISLYQLAKKFPNEETARNYMEAQRWPTGAICPTCGEATRIGKRPKGFYRCNACRVDFTVRTGSIFGRSHIPLDKWILGIYLLMTARKGISSVQLSKEIGISQSAAWFMLQRLREACGNDPTVLSGIVEIDETYIGGKEKNMLAFEFEMGLFPAVLEEARSKGIDLAPKYIPAEVFDKRAVDKGQVVFHDISFVEAAPRYDKKAKLALQIELKDFSVYYTQGAAEAAIAAMKEGKSEVMCEQGQLYKVSKNKDGVVTKDRLTKHWTDWVDYWAVDFDYMSRKEIIKVPVDTGVRGKVALPGLEADQGEFGMATFEERWTGGYIFENEWQSFRTRQDRDLELTTASHTYEKPGRYTVAVKVIDIFGNDTMTLFPVNVG